MQDEWYEIHGWAANPPAEVVAQWRAAAEAEVVYRTGEVRSTSADSETTIGATLPDALVVPAHPRVDGSAGFSVELAEVNGTTVMLGYSSVDKLVDQLGASQPWVAMSASDVAVNAALPIVVDPVPGIVRATWSGERLTALRNVLAHD